MTTPFELRFKLLEMAQRYFEFVDARTRDFTDEAWSHAKEQGDATLEYWENLQPKALFYRGYQDEGEGVI